MTDAYVIENAGETAGIVVLERGGVRFYASERLYGVLDGVRYRSVRAAHNAVIDIQRQAAAESVRMPSGILAAQGERQVVAGRRAAA